MKNLNKLLSLALIWIILISSALTIHVSALKHGSLTYNVSNGEIIIEDCNVSAVGTLEIPSEINGYPVTCIGNGAFNYCKGLTSVTIPDGIKHIGNYAFSNCRKLTSIIIPDSVTEIGNYAFSECYKLSSITLSENITAIGAYTFYLCSSLNSITVPNGVTSIGHSAFTGCSDLTTAILPESIISLADYAFSDCAALSDIVIPDSILSIGNYAFCGCRSLTAIAVSNGITVIADGVFEYCSNLTCVTIPNSVISIGSSAFSGCSSLTSATIPDSVETIGNDAFYGCTLLVLSVLKNSSAHVYAVDNSLSYSLICEHINTEIKNSAASTYTESGYTDDIYCIDCGIVLESGTIVYADCDFNKDGKVDEEDINILEQSSFEPENTASFDFDRDGGNTLSSFDKTVAKLLTSGVEFSEMVDVNNDGKTNILDIVRLKKLLAGACTEGSIDRDGDGNSDSNDTVFTRKFLLFVDPELYNGM